MSVPYNHDKAFFPGPNSQFSYQVFFMRKLWSSTVPGKDRCADIIFHFHQELPKLLRGYHQCTKEEAAILGALVYRVKFAESKTDISSVLKSLLPSDLLKVQSSYEWKKEIARAYNKDSGMSPDEAKIAFLKVIYRWPTYGSAFFEAHQTSDPSFPEHLIVAINKQGVNIIHSQSKVTPFTTTKHELTNLLTGPTGHPPLQPHHPLGVRALLLPPYGRGQLLLLQADV